MNMDYILKLIVMLIAVFVLLIGGSALLMNEILFNIKKIIPLTKHEKTWIIVSCFGLILFFLSKLLSLNLDILNKIYIGTVMIIIGIVIIVMVWNKTDKISYKLRRCLKFFIFLVCNSVSDSIIMIITICMEKGIKSNIIFGNLDIVFNEVVMKSMLNFIIIYIPFNLLILGIAFVLGEYIFKIRNKFFYGNKTVGRDWGWRIKKRILFFCYGLFIFSFLLKWFNLSILILWLILKIILFSLGYRIGKTRILNENKEININFVNLKFKDMISSRIHYSGYIKFPTPSMKINMRVFKIDMKQFFPEDARNCEIIVLNQLYTVPLECKEKRPKKYFYFCVEDNFKKIKNYKLRLLLYYKNEKDDKYFTNEVVLYINVLKKEEEIFIRDFFVEQYYRYSKLIDGKEKELGIKVSAPKINHIFNLCKKSYRYNFDVNDRGSEFNKDKELKWLYHNDEYGNGKTTLDKILSINSGYVPVPISVWEANYDEDFLFLMYKKVLEASAFGKKSWRPYLFFYIRHLLFGLLLLGPL